MDLSRFDKRNGVGDPVHRNPKSPQERTANMRGSHNHRCRERTTLEFGMDDHSELKDNQI